ncbi:trypsin-like peptidase domain-containing protein [Clostridium sp. 19966]|uniref:S1C family serine protease n=1 Tax=Clostridium sp. 19966 TaxID=2768166 RepID=UPI0028DF3036|nr:trypsin-like peptidase domain-containing protein [Clostridium sp. 19966]MDT8715738.1 trypsin-like peptidase domain-containing protein [Clostridium sp. 19966]
MIGQKISDNSSLNYFENNKGEDIIKEDSNQCDPIINYGTINFRSNKTKRKIRYICRGMVFLFVAALSGGTTAYVLVNNQMSKIAQKYNEGSTNIIVNSSQAGNVTSSSVVPKNSINYVAEKVGPTVVGISNSAESFLGKETNSFSGSGIIFNSDGYIITNYHVISDSDKIMVKLPNETTKTYEAKIISVDKSLDLAIIKIDAPGLVAANFGDSSKVRVGDIAVAIGNPLGEELAGTVSAGIISSTNKKLQYTDGAGNTFNYNTLQTDAAIDSGSSGGALCNEVGEVIGITSLRMNAQGAGFAICINDVSKFIKEATTDKAKLQVSEIGIIDGGTAGHNSGAYLRTIAKDSPADKAGIQYSDIVIQVNSKKIKSYDQMVEAIGSIKKGDAIKLKIDRNGKMMDITIQYK